MSALVRLMEHCDRFGLVLRIDHTPLMDVPWGLSAARGGVDHGDIAYTLAELEAVARTTLDELLTPVRPPLAIGPAPSAETRADESARSHQEKGSTDA